MTEKEQPTKNRPLKAAAEFNVGGGYDGRQFRCAPKINLVVEPRITNND